MNGSKSPAPPSTEAGEVSTAEALPNIANGQRTPEREQPTSSEEQQQQQQENTKDVESSSAPVEVKDEAMTDAPADVKPESSHVASAHEGADEYAESEAETLITSPVKKRESEKQRNNTSAAVKSEPQQQQQQPPPPPPARMPAPRHRIGGLPVPTDGDDDMDSTASPVPSTETSAAKTTASTTSTTEAAPKDEEMEDRLNSDNNSNDLARSEKKDKSLNNNRRDDDDDDDDSDRGSGSDSLSSVRSDQPSRASSRSRAASERPEYARHGHDGTHSPNPRKRKHRASSVSLPNKRPSVHAAKPRRLRGLHSEELAGRSEQSPSPKLRSHRRAVSTQSAFMDGAAEHAHRKRRAVTQGPARSDTKTSSKAGWDESDASSETTSHGQPDARRPARGVGRSTSTPGRPPGREHKRHVNKYGFTRLAEACESGDLDLVKEWRDKDPDQLELAEFAGNKPLQIAALNGNVEVVDYLIDQGCQIDCANVDKDTPLIDAAENGHVDVVKSLLNAGVDPLRQNLKGQQALDVVTDDTDDVDEIRAALRKAIDQWNSDGAKQRREEEEEQRHRAGPTKELHFMARTYENLLRLVQINDRTGVREFLDARVPVDNAIITAAAKTGDLYLINMLLAEMTEKKAFQKPEKPMLGVLGTSHFEMVKSLTELDQFNPLYRNRQGLSWPEIADQRNGPNARQEVELLQKLYNARNAMKERRSSSPVTKRESGKRRLMQAGEDDSEDEGAPKRKNGRRLMSRKDMRAASGKAASDSSSDESGSDIVVASEAGDDASMKPPESPPAKRGPGRPRTKSISGPSSETSPGSRRRSSSIRADQALPTVEEKVEEKLEEKVEEKDANDRLREQERQRSIEEAAKLEAQRKQHEATEAAAKKALEEEAARQAEEERRANDIRQQEEERRAAEARRAEQERKRIEEEMAEAQRVHRARILASLPGAVAHVLDKQSSFQSDSDKSRLSSYLLQHFTPLQVVRQGHQSADGAFLDGPEAPYWVVNVQAAPLLGQDEAGKSIETMVRPDIPGYKDSIADALGLKEVLADEKTRVASMLANVLDDFPLHTTTDIDKDGLSLLSFEKELRRASERSSSVASIKERLCGGDAILRYMELDTVLKELHHVLRGAQIDVRFDHLQSDTTRCHVDKEGTGFVERLGALLDKRPRACTYVDGSMLTPNTPTSALGSTRVTVVHSK